MKDKIPHISVIMPVYNGANYLRDAIESIINQTFRDFEFIIIDDDSTDGTPEILAEYARRDTRVRLLRNEANLGLTPTINRGLESARAPIIARMDADDISAPERLERQVAFLDANPAHLFVTTGYRAIDHTGRTLYVKVKPADDFCVRWLMRFRMCLEHPSACFRARLPDGTPARYDESLVVGEDFEFFSRLIAAGKGAILPEVLFSYRRHPVSITNMRRDEVMANYLRIAKLIQQRELPADLAGCLSGLMRCYLLLEPATPSVVHKSVAAFDRMLAHDLKSRPDARVWLRRQAAEILADALLRRGRGFGSPRVTAAFLLHARRYLWPLLWRVLENKGYLPRWLESFPDPAGR